MARFAQGPGAETTQGLSKGGPVLPRDKQAAGIACVLPFTRGKKSLLDARVAHDGYFDVKCFDAQASACAQYLKAGRDVAVDGRLLFDEFQTQDGAYASRIYIVAERVEFLDTRKATNGQANDDAGDGAERPGGQAA